MKVTRHLLATVFLNSRLVHKPSTVINAVYPSLCYPPCSHSFRIVSSSFFMPQPSSCSLLPGSTTITSIRNYHRHTRSLPLSFPLCLTRGIRYRSMYKVTSPSAPIPMIPVGYSYPSSFCRDRRDVKVGETIIKESQERSDHNLLQGKREAILIKIHCSNELENIIQEKAEHFLRRGDHQTQKTNMGRGLNSKERPIFHRPTARYLRFQGYPFMVFIMLLLYFITVVYLIFFVFDWNLVEPTTFFTGQMVALWGMWHHMQYLGTVPFSWSGIFALLMTGGRSKKIKRY